MTFITNAVSMLWTESEPITGSACVFSVELHCAACPALRQPAL
nr:hypothetical protein [Bradyrhizobium sp. SZCCHNR2009]